MREDLDKELCRKYPRLYADRNASPRDTALCWGFQCDSGWYQILDDLSAELEAEITRIALEHGEEASSQVRATTVKEKFGALRVYLTRTSDEMDMLISEAELRSSRTCEVTGKPGRIRSVNGWLSCLSNEEYYKALASAHLRGAYVAGKENSEDSYKKALEFHAHRLENLLEPNVYSQKERAEILFWSIIYKIRFALRHPIYHVKQTFRSWKYRITYRLWRINRKRKGLWVA